MDRGSTTRRGSLAIGGLACILLLGASVGLAGSGLPRGSVKQVAGKDGCYTADGSSAAGPGTCRDIRGGDGATSVVLAPGGRHAYVVGYGGTPEPVLSILRRNRRSGKLRQLAGRDGCHSIDGASEDGPGTCRNARNLDTGDATSIAISRDGRFVYVASQLHAPPVAENAGGVAIFKRNTRNGKLRQLPGKRGCVSATGASEDGAGTCAVARQVESVSNLKITPDGKYLYASQYATPEGIAIFRRNARRGTLKQLRGRNGCLSRDGKTAQSGGNLVCRVSKNIYDPWDVATPDNRFAYIPSAYVTGAFPDLVQAYKRNRAGGLVPLKGKRGCVSNDGTSPAGACVDGRGLDNVERAIVSKNKRFLYVGSYSPPAPIAVLNRNPKTGKLSQRAGNAACISSDGTSGGDAGACRDGRAISGNYAGALTPDGRTLYFTSYSVDALTVFRVSPKRGGFRQLGGSFGCVTPDGSSPDDGPGTCRVARAIEGPYQVELGGGGRDVYVAAYGGNGVVHLRARR